MTTDRLRQELVIRGFSLCRKGRKRGIRGMRRRRRRKKKKKKKMMMMMKKKKKKKEKKYEEEFT